LLQENFIYRGVIGDSKILVGVSAVLVEIGTYLVVQQGVQSMQASVDFWPSTPAAPD